MPFPPAVYRAIEFDVFVPLCVAVGTVFPIQFQDGGVGTAMPVDNRVTIGGETDPFPGLVPSSITVVDRGVSASIEDVIACPGETVRVRATVDLRAHPDVVAYQLSVIVAGSAAAGVTVPSAQTGSDIGTLVLPGGTHGTSPAVNPATGAVSEAVYRTGPPGNIPFPKGVYVTVDMFVTIPASVPAGTVFPVEFRDGAEATPGVPVSNLYVEGGGRARRSCPWLRAASPS
jgi:hypothetical protein